MESSSMGVSSVVRDFGLCGSVLVQRGQRYNRGVSVGGSTSVPKAGPEVITTGHEAWVGGGVDDTADDVVVTQGQKVLPLCRSGVPAA